MAFWERVEAWLIELQNDRPRMARYMLIAWWVSSAMVVLGVLVMLLVATGAWPL